MAIRASITPDDSYRIAAHSITNALPCFTIGMWIEGMLGFLDTGNGEKDDSSEHITLLIAQGLRSPITLIIVNTIKATHNVAHVYS